MREMDETNFGLLPVQFELELCKGHHELRAVRLHFALNFPTITTH